MVPKYVIILVSILYFQEFYCLYEDQIGKFDWNQRFVGKLKYSIIDSKATTKRAIIATEENVIASVSLKSGDVLWRQVLERGEPGSVQLLHVDTEVVTVNGVGPFLVRAWNLNAGYLHYEWTIHLPDRPSNIKWLVHQGKLYQIILMEAAAEVTGYNLRAGTKSASSKTVTASWITPSTSRCELAGLSLVCVSGSGRVSAMAVWEPSPRLLSLELGEPVAALEPVVACHTETPALDLRLANSGDRRLLLVDTITAALRLSPILLPHSAPTLLALYPHAPGSTLLVTVEQNKGSLVVSGFIAETGVHMSQMSGRVDHTYPLQAAGAAILSASCVLRRDRSPLCHMVLVMTDHAVLFLQTPNKLLWVREEALANIVTVEMVELPVSVEEAAIEKEFDNKQSGMLGMFSRRLVSQLLQVHSLLFTVLGFLEPASSAGRLPDLVRDDFGLHKLIVAVTTVGKVFGIDNLSGELVWQQVLDNATPYRVTGKLTVPLFVQRTTRHIPYPAQCTLLFQHKISQESFLFVFNPITGEPIDGGIVPLSYRVVQATLLPQVNEEFIKGILLMDDRTQMHVYPHSAYRTALTIAQSLYLYTVDPTTGVLSGYSLAMSNRQSLLASPTWEMRLGKGVITHVVGKSPLEKVHSQGRVLADRSVLYKYINPNLIVVTTSMPDLVHKSVLSVYVVDAVSGSIVFSGTHKRAVEPVHIVHSENWLVYSYFSEKSRRTEISTLEFYEGKSQSSASAFSSLSGYIQPTVERQAYILPASIEAMRETITEKGITSKHILVALSSGGLLEVPWTHLDPRRPLTVTPEMREEGVLQYVPELPFSAESIVNYNQTLQRIAGIYTTPSRLESTCLVFAYGLDLFYSRVAPSKQFDVLKEDFDYMLITVVLAALSGSAYITKRLASRKALKQAWK